MIARPGRWGAATMAAYQGRRVAVLERCHRVGGAVVNRGGTRQRARMMLSGPRPVPAPNRWSIIGPPPLLNTVP